MTSILVYTFFGYAKATSRGLYNYNDQTIPFDKLFIPNRFGTSRLIEKLDLYDYVIGIADHNKNATKSRFDPVYINKYSNRIIKADSPEQFSANLNLILPETFYTFAGSTNGPCNRSAYFCMNEITSKCLHTTFGFFHLHKKNWASDLATLLHLITSRS
ncbi:MAG: hypothetical protein ACOYT9_03600 [Patescibacteria group bacterium]